jgi:hypothetical protein
MGLSQNERDIVDAFYKKHETGEKKFKNKIFNIILTFTENAIKKFPSLFKHLI